MFLIVPEVCSIHLPQLKDMMQVNTPWYERYMKVVCNSNASLPKRSFTWDAGAVVKYLSSIIPKSLLGISRKLASLLAILCAQRGREILSVMDI